MPEHAILYFLRHVPKLEMLLDPPGSGGMVVSRTSDGEADVVVTTVGPARVDLALVAADELRAHLDRFHAYLTQECELGDPALPGAVRSARGVVAVTLEPGFDPGGECERFLRKAAGRTDALLFLESGTLEDGKGRPLARPLSAAAEAEGAAEGAPQAPTKERVAKRALAIAALTWRGWLETERPANAGEQIAACCAWLERHGVLEEMDPRERGLVRSAPTSWAERDRIDRGWAIEGAAVLAWALGLYELPAHDVKVLPPPLGTALGLFAAEPAALAVPSLRSEAEIAAMAARLRGIHARLSEFIASPGAVDFAAFSRSAPSGSFDAAGIPLAEDDLAVAGQPLSRAPENAVQSVLGIAVERHRAVSWLQGGIDPAATRGPADGERAEGAPVEE